MKSVLHKANTRGHANHGWLDTHHSFSFAGYYNPERMGFGALRVLNDDIVEKGYGFGTHPHNNMEIISIPLEGELEHKDSMGNVHVIRENDIQVLSAGSGIQHSEFNRSKDVRTNFLQIWVVPNKRDVTPRYDQMTFDPETQKNQLAQILSPNPDDEGVWVHQNAWFSRGRFDKATSITYNLHDPKNGVYAFVLDGKFNVEGIDLLRRDGLGIVETPKLEINVTPGSEILLMEVPL